jgi:hypothetical protein
VLLEQQLGHRFADDIRSPEHHGAKPRQVAEAVLEQHEAAERRAGHDGVAAHGQEPGVARVKSVGVLGRIDRLDDGLGADLLGQGQLNQDAVDGRVLVQAPDEIEQLGFGGAGVEPMLERLHTRRDRLARLVAHVDLTRRIFAHEHHGQPGRHARVLGKPRHLRADPLPQRRREGLAIDNRSVP